MLKRLQIRNFRGFNALEINQLSGINLIAGKNNSGKTSLLEAIFLLAGGGNAQMAVNTNVTRGTEPDGVPVSDPFWKQLFFNLDMGRPIEIEVEHTSHGQLALEISLEQQPATSLDSVVWAKFRRRTFSTNVRSYFNIVVLQVNGLRAIYKKKESNLSSVRLPKILHFLQ